MVGVHPCTYVSEGINVCIVGKGEEPSKENCWTVDSCKKSRPILEPFSPNSAVKTAGLALLPILYALL